MFICNKMGRLKLLWDERQPLLFLLKPLSWSPAPHRSDPHQRSDTWLSWRCGWRRCLTLNAGGTDGPWRQRTRSKVRGNGDNAPFDGSGVVPDSSPSLISYFLFLSSFGGGLINNVVMMIDSCTSEACSSSSSWCPAGPPRPRVLSSSVTWISMMSSKNFDDVIHKKKKI